jgi:DNA-binding transcriptional MerR regulator
MYSIGELSRRTGVKVPTIRYYESIGLIASCGRSAGNQRRFDRQGIDRLAFIRHARALGFPLDAIRALLDLSDDPETPCAEADRIAAEQLADTRARIARLERLAAELERIAH